jgi:hypothetical protein
MPLRPLSSLPTCSPPPVTYHFSFCRHICKSTCLLCSKVIIYYYLYRQVTDMHTRITGIGDQQCTTNIKFILGLCWLRCVSQVVLHCQCPEIPQKMMWRLSNVGKKYLAPQQDSSHNLQQKGKILPLDQSRFKSASGELCIQGGKCRYERIAGIEGGQHNSTNHNSPTSAWPIRFNQSSMISL